MIYGLMIRQARETLNLYQRDIADDNLSRNLLSNIEAGKTALTAQKGIIIYRNILAHAVKKKLYVDLEFDALLSENLEYSALKNAYAAIRHLETALSGEITLTNKEIQEYIALADRNKIGIMRYYIYFNGAQLIDNDDTLKYKTCFKALDYLKWENMEKVMSLYQECLQFTYMVAYKNNRIEQLIHYYEILLDAQKQFMIRVRVSIYYNLSLFYNILNKFDQSLEYLDLYLERHEDMSLTDYADAMIIKAILLTKSNRIEEGLVTYQFVLEKIDGTGHLHQRSLCLSNTVYNISKNDLDYRIDLLKVSLDELLLLVKELKTSVSSRASLFSNIAQGYSYLNNYEAALSYFVKSLELCPNMNKKVLVLNESYPTYLAIGKLPYMLKELQLIDSTQLNAKTEIIFYKLLLKIKTDDGYDAVEQTIRNSFNMYLKQI